MKKSVWIIVAIIAVVAILFVSGYNDLVSEKADVEESFANIDAQLQRRADLIPNLVESVKGITEHEKAVVDAVTSARENYLNAGSDNEKIAAGSELSAALSNLLVVVENYASASICFLGLPLFLPLLGGTSVTTSLEDCSFSF